MITAIIGIILSYYYAFDIYVLPNVEPLIVAGILECVIEGCILLSRNIKD